VIDLEVTDIVHLARLMSALRAADAAIEVERL
jgi:hypothetical protein